MKKVGSIAGILHALFFSLLLMVFHSGFACAQTVILNQPPNQTDAIASDPDIPDSVAENFNLSSAATIAQIKIWGIYFRTNTPGTDNFTVIFHADSPGHMPGDVISTQHNVPAARRMTGGPDVIGRYREYQYTLNLTTPVTLAPGTYWVEIFNDVTGTGDLFYWEFGTLDAARGIPGIAFFVTVPGSSFWMSENAYDLAIEMIEVSPVPAMNEWGMVIFVFLAGAGSIYLLRRRAKV